MTSNEAEPILPKPPALVSSFSSTLIGEMPSPEAAHAPSMEMSLLYRTEICLFGACTWFRLAGLYRVTLVPPAVTTLLIGSLQSVPLFSLLQVKQPCFLSMMPKLMLMYVCFSPHSTSYLSSGVVCLQREPQVPQVEGWLLQDRPSLHARLLLSFSDWLYRSEVLTTPALGSMNLLEGLAELRGTIY